MSGALLGKGWYAEYVAQPEDIAWNKKNGMSEEKANYEAIVYNGKVHTYIYIYIYIYIYRLSFANIV